MFSATIPKEVHQIGSVALKQGYKFIDTVGEEECATNVQVDQHYVRLSLSLSLSPPSLSLYVSLYVCPQLKLLFNGYR